MEIGYLEHAEILIWAGEKFLRNRLTGEVYIVTGTIWGSNPSPLSVG